MSPALIEAGRKDTRVLLFTYILFSFSWATLRINTGIYNDRQRITHACAIKRTILHKLVTYARVLPGDVETIFSVNLVLKMFTSKSSGCPGRILILAYDFSDNFDATAG